MLSRRVVELESYIATGELIGAARPAGPTTAAANSRSERERILVESEPISRDEIVSVLELTAARNKILETEVKILAERVSRIYFHEPLPFLNSFTQLEDARSARRRISAYAGASTIIVTHPLNP